MVTINLYQAGKVNETIDFPSEWNELTTADLECIAAAILSPNADKVSQQNAIFLSMLQRRTQVKNLLQKINLEDLAMSSLDHTLFIINENNLTQQPYPTVRLRQFPYPLTVDGPESDFNSITCGEFEDAEQYAFKFNENPSHEPLARLAAVLYRPNKHPFFSIHSKTGHWLPYDSAGLLPYFLKLSPVKLYTIYTWYTGCKSQLPKFFPTVFGGRSSNQDPDPMVFTKCIHAGAGERNGTREKIRMTLLKEYFFDMELEAIKSAELKKQMEQHARR